MKSNLNLLDIFDDIANEISIRRRNTNKYALVELSDQIHAINSWSDESEAELRRIGYTNPTLNLDQIINGWNQQVITINKSAADNILAVWDPNTTVGPDRADGWHIGYSNIAFPEAQEIQYLPMIDTSKLLNACYFLSFLYNLVSIPQLNTSKVTNMYGMFSSCRSLAAIPQLDTSSVADMSYMFEGCSSLKTIPILNTKLLSNCYSMFEGCRLLTTIPELNIINVIGTDDMFKGCTSLKEIHMKNINASLNLTWIEHDYSHGYAEVIKNCPLEHDALIELISNLLPVDYDGSAGRLRQLQLGEVLKAKLSPEEIKVATDKGWTVV